MIAMPTYIISELSGRGVRVSVVVLDACRTNPFGRSGSKGIGGSKGLARPPQVQGIFSLYAASGGRAALDRLYDGDPNSNSVFSRVLVPMLAKPGLDLATLAFEVREEVARIAQKAGQTQRPAYYDETIGGRVYLAGVQPEREPAGGQPAPAVSEVAQVWGAVQNTTSIAVIDDFIRQFGNAPVYGSLARARREELAKEATKEAAKEPRKAPVKTEVAVVGSPMRSQTGDPCVPVEWKASLSSQKNCQRRRQNSLPLRYREFATNHCARAMKWHSNRHRGGDPQNIPAKIPCRQGTAPARPAGDRFARSFAGMTLQ
jgi:hypothetical protein